MPVSIMVVHTRMSAFAVHHSLHDGGQFLLAHLAVAHHHPDLRPQQFLDAGGGEVDGLHPVVEVVDLTARANSFRMASSRIPQSCSST